MAKVNKHKNKKPFKLSKAEKEREFTNLQKRLTEISSCSIEKVRSFAQFPISRATLKGLKDCCYTEPTLVQKLTLPPALVGHDVVVDAKTGSGKTLAFAIPVVENLFKKRWCNGSGVGAIIITPTRELALQIHAVMKKIAYHHQFTCALVIGGQDLDKERYFMNYFNIIVCTPGRLHQHMKETDNFDYSTLTTLVLDEADLCLSMGFADKMNDILYELPKTRHTMLFSATQTRKIKNFIRSGCKKPMFVSLNEHSTISTPSTLKQHYTVCEAHDKAKFLAYLFTLLQLHMYILCLHGDLKQHKRKDVYNTFMNNKRIVLIATDIAARGLDFENIDWVVQMDCPEDVTTYIHRVGRTARYFRDGNALLVLTERESSSMLKQLEQNKVPLQELNVLPDMIISQDRRIEDLVCKDSTLLNDAQKAFKAYLKHQVFMKDSTIFDVSSVNQEKLAKSYGLVSTPRVRFVERALRKPNTKTYVEAVTEQVLSPSTDAANKDADIADDKALFKTEAIKQVSVEAKLCPYSNRFDEIFKTAEILTGPLATPPTDYSKYLLKDNNVKMAEINTSTDQLSLFPLRWQSVNDALAIVDMNREKLAKIHQQKLKEHKKNLIQKRAQKRGRVQKDADGVNLEGSCFSSDEEELDPYTQRLIDELPDPDKVRGEEERDEQDMLSTDTDEQDVLSTDTDERHCASSEEKELEALVALRKRKRTDVGISVSKVRKIESGHESDSSSSDLEDANEAPLLQGLSLQQQEKLALRLLKGS